MQSDSSNSAKAALPSAGSTSKPGIQAWLSENRIRLFKFASVGASGVLVNLLVFELCYRLILPPILAGDRLFTAANTAGGIISIFTNFLLNDMWTWSDREKGTLRHAFTRLTKYYIAASTALVVQLAVSWLSLTMLWSHLELQIFNWELSPMFAVITGIGVGMFFNFAASHLWTFRDIDRE